MAEVLFGAPPPRNHQATGEVYNPEYSNEINSLKLGEFEAEAGESASITLHFDYVQYTFALSLLGNVKDDNSAVYVFMKGFYSKMRSSVTSNLVIDVDDVNSNITITIPDTMETDHKFVVYITLFGDIPDNILVTKSGA